MNYSYEYNSMREMIKRARTGFAGALNEDVSANPNIMSDKDSQLQKQTLDSETSGTKITLDNNKVASVVADTEKVSENITIGLQKMLNGYLEAVRGTIDDTSTITVHLGDSSAVVSVGVIMGDGQPATVSVNSQSKNVQLKYDNFLQLTENNLKFMVATQAYFNATLMSFLQGEVSAV